jgi:hypothetical protein
MKLPEVVVKARFGHKDWIMWKGDKAAPLTREALKVALLETGTQGRITLVWANSAILECLTFGQCVRMLRSLRFTI